MSGYKPLGFTKGRVATIDEYIKQVEQLVEDNKVKHIITVVVEYGNPCKVHVMPMNAPLDDTIEILKIAIGAVEEFKAAQS